MISIIQYNNLKDLFFIYNIYNFYWEMTDIIAYTVLLSAWVHSMTFLSMNDIFLSFQDESKLNFGSEYLKSSTAKTMWTVMFMIALACHLFVLYVYTTGAYDFKNTYPDSYHERYDWLIAYLSLVFVCNFVMLCFKFYMYAYWYKRTLTAISGGLFSSHKGDEVKTKRYFAIGLYYFNFFVFVTFLIMAMVVLYTTPNISISQRGTSTPLLLTTACIIILNGIFHTLTMTHSKTGGMDNVKYKSVIEANLNKHGIFIFNKFDGSEIDTKELGNHSEIKDKMKLDNDDPHLPLLQLAERVAYTKDAQSNHISPSNFRVRSLNGKYYLLNPNVAAKIDYMIGNDPLIQKSLIGYNLKLGTKNEGESQRSDTFPENEFFFIDAMSSPLLTDYNNLAQGLTFFTHDVCGYGTGIGTYVNFSNSMIIPFIFFMLPFYIYFLMNTNYGVMIWIVSVLTAFYPSLHGKFGQFWELFLYSFIYSWITVIGIHQWVPESDNYIYNFYNFQNSDSILNVSVNGSNIDEGFVYYSGTTIAFTLALFGFIFEIRNLYTSYKHV